MRICWPVLFKMLRHTTRCNVLLVILCLGLVIFVWSRCQLSNLELNLNDQYQYVQAKSLPRTIPNIKDFERNLNDREEKLEKGLRSEREEQEDKDSESEEVDESEDDTANKPSRPYRNIKVLVNGDKTIEGYIEKKEVYIPFSFIKDYFEIDGKIIRDSFGKKFEFRHTYYEYFTPSTDTYNPRGSFMWFVNYNVEGRSRVKCITGVDEVPVSTQWGPEGYHYPIQIAQYGLSHYSVMMESGGSDKKSKVVDDCEKPGNQEWSTTGQGASFNNIFDSERKSRIVEFETQELPDNGVFLSLTSSSKLYILSFDILFKSPGKITVILEVDDTKKFTIVYKTTTEIMAIDKSTVTYGIGMAKTWRRITRNLLVDLHKAFGEKSKRGKSEKKRKLRLTEIQSMSLHGKGLVDNITLAETGHEAAFLASAQWFVKNQDKKGGWSIPVKRKIRGGAELDAGWYSAMAQGQAMSVLTRAYYYTKDQRYLDVAQKGTALFHVKSQNHGIVAIFMGRYKWYEEYPLTPSLFVLNGFIYSLMGLYDLKMALPAETRKDAENIFKEGMLSLRAMILMFDTGSGTIYDLRHLTMGPEINLARWDYHATHVNQLTWITQIDSDPFYKKVLERWKGYFKGLRSNHN